MERRPRLSAALLLSIQRSEETSTAARRVLQGLSRPPAYTLAGVRSETAGVVPRLFVDGATRRTRPACTPFPPQRGARTGSARAAVRAAWRSHVFMLRQVIALANDAPTLTDAQTAGPAAGAGRVVCPVTPPPVVGSLAAGRRRKGVATSPLWEVLALASSSDLTDLTSNRVKALILSPVVVLFAAAARLLIISNYDTTTATTIASSGGAVGTLLGTVVPLVPPFLPAIVVFFIIFRRWGLALLTALFTALVSPMYIESVKDGLSIAADSGRGAWREIIAVFPGLQGIVHIVWIILGWIVGVLGYILVQFARFLRGPRIELDSRGPWPALYEWSHGLLPVWNHWQGMIRVAVICTLATLLWALYAPPWSYILKSSLPPREVSESERVIDGVARLISAAVWLLGIAIYSVCVAAACGFFVLYVQNAYHVSFDKKGISEIVRRPWLPAEEITLSSGDTLVGYTLSSSVGWQVVLMEPTRTIRYLRATEVTGRKVCHMTTPTKPSPSPLIKFDGVVPGGVPLCRRV